MKEREWKKERRTLYSEYIDRKRIGTKARNISKEAEEGLERGKEIKLLADSGPK